MLCGCMRVCVCVCEGLSLCVCVGAASFNALAALTRVSSPSGIAVLETKRASRRGLEVGGRFEVRGVAVVQCA